MAVHVNNWTTEQWAGTGFAATTMFNVAMLWWLAYDERFLAKTSEHRGYGDSVHVPPHTARPLHLERAALVAQVQAGSRSPDDRPWSRRYEAGRETPSARRAPTAVSRAVVAATKS